MRAAQISEYGDASIIKVNEAEKPTLKDGQVLIEVHSSSLNPFDTSIRLGFLQQAIPLEFPVTLGGDIAGVVVELGTGVSGFEIGDKVYGQANVVAGNSGAFAEFSATSFGQIARMPKTVDFNNAAALPLVGVSALQALTEHIKLEAGQKILIHGGAGGIGSVAVQLAKNFGAYVAVTVAEEDVDYAKSLGADEVIDYKTQNFVDILGDYDAVFDTVGGDIFEQSIKVLKSGAVAVSMIAKLDESIVKEHDIQVITQSTHVKTQALEELAKLVDDGIITVRIDSVFPLDEITKAFEKRENNPKGKVVIELQAKT